MSGARGVPITSEFDWSPANVQRLCDLWAFRDKAGNPISAGRIGQIMGASKNAVIGKAHRLKLPGRESPIVRNGQSHAPRRPARAPAQTLPALRSIAVPERPAAPQIVATPPKPAAVVLTSMPCCFPLWGNERPTHEYCGAKSRPGRSYCAEHMTVTTATPREVPAYLKSAVRSAEKFAA